MDKNDEITVMNIALKNPDLVRDKAISTSQLRTYNAVEAETAAGEGMTTRCLANQEGITIQAANGKLTKLYYKGYLTRVNAGAPSGGDEFYYYTAL